jgi:hypothetical protein
MQFREMLAVYTESHTKRLSSLRGHMAMLNWVVRVRLDCLFE